MKTTEQTITLTPPIDGVQYGISAKIKAGDWCLLDNNVGQSTGFEIKKCLEVNIPDGEYTFKEDDGSLFTTGRCDSIICSTNPKDTRFPYLQLVCPTCGKREFGVCSNSWHKTVPSKEQEVEQKMEKLIYGCFGKIEWDAIHKNAKLALIETFMNNPAKYTQEDMIEFAEYQQEYQHHTTNNNFQTWLLKQSIQPTAKAVRVEMVDNGYEIDMGGVGGMQLGETNWLSKMEIKVKQSTEHPQGVIRTIEVIN